MLAQVANEKIRTLGFRGAVERAIARGEREELEAILSELEGRDDPLLFGKPLDRELSEAIATVRAELRIRDLEEITGAIAEAEIAAEVAKLATDAAAFREELEGFKAAVVKLREELAELRDFPVSSRLDATELELVKVRDELRRLRDGGGGKRDRRKARR